MSGFIINFHLLIGLLFIIIGIAIVFIIHKTCFRTALPKMKIDYKPGQEQVLFGAKEGNFRSRFDRIRLVLHQFDPVSQLTVDGNARPVKVEGNVQVVEWENKKESMLVQFRR